MHVKSQPVYSCKEITVDRFPSFHDEVWLNLDVMELRETVSGNKARLSTQVQSFWSRNRNCLYFRFVCEDDNVVSTMRNHDDPIYEEDVVEVFISESGKLNLYKEFEMSPANVRFNAIIANEPPNPIQVDKKWHAYGWETAVSLKEDLSQFISVWEIPFTNFEGGCPSAGDSWLLNCYRIDRGIHGEDQYMAWSPTGAEQFHVPACFGSLLFEL